MTTKALGKTAQDLLDRARRNPAKTVAVSFGVYKRKGWGKLTAKTAGKLVADGRMTLVQRFVDHESARGRHSVTYTHVYKLTNTE